MYEALKSTMSEYYKGMHFTKQGHFEDPECERRFYKIRNAVFAEMDEFRFSHTDTPSILLKSRLHTVIAKHFEPVIFHGNPFFFEMGIRESQSWGLGSLQPSSWLRLTKMKDVREEHPLEHELTARFGALFLGGDINACSENSPFDTDHHTLGFTTLFDIGIGGIIDKVKEKLATLDMGSEDAHFCEAVIESCHALIRVAEKFADKASELLDSCKETRQRKFLGMIAECAKKIPKDPPQTFYEGLCMLLFTREAIGSLECIGISNLGHVDRLLYPLYQKDIRDGKLTETEARELVYLWMMYTDVKYDIDSNHWPETSTCIQLGGCDEKGRIVFNEVTKIFITEHQKAHLVNPKLNCRYSKSSPSEYLELIGEAIIKGHNNFVLINDDIIIKGLIKSGVAAEDARLFVSGGCQETMIEGCGHTEGAGLYVSMPKLLDLFLRGGKGSEYLNILDKADTYEELYEKFLGALRRFLGIMTDQRAVRQYFRKEAYLCPLFSATQKDCIENSRDYVLGGARYNFSTVALVGLANISDSLYAIKDLVYDKKSVTLEELLRILSENWENNEQLRLEAVSLPKYGHGDKTVDDVANRFLSDIAAIISSRKNERGGSYIPSTFVYYYHKHFSTSVRATPDGRKNGDLLAMGCSPSQLMPIENITDTLGSMANMDFTMCGGGASVLDVMIPASEKLTPQIFASLAFSCADLGCPTLQPNVLSVTELIDAKEHPEKHRDLIVRISGLSAKFTALRPAVQDEIISRNIYSI